MRCVPLITALLVLALVSSPARAWWDAGHMQIAYLAYKRLDAPVRDKVDALLKLNNDYAKWTAGAPDDRTAKLYAFVHAATWADDIKTREYHYTRDKVDSPTAGQNIGYTDHNQHAYWHFRDINFSPDGEPLPAGDPVDLVTQAKLMIMPSRDPRGPRMMCAPMTLSGFFIWSVMPTSRFTQWGASRSRFRTATRAATPSL